MHDVIVVGGGPSGLNAARRLAEKGHDVLVLERKSALGKNIVCTGIVGREIFGEFQLPTDSVITEIKDVKIVSPSSGLLSYEHPQAFASIVDRETFDRDIGDMARSSGAKIRTDAEVLDMSVHKDRVNVLTKSRDGSNLRFNSQLILLATGTNYRLHKKPGLGYPTRFLNGVHVELDVGGLECTHLFTGTNFAPGAFAWAVPLKNGMVRIGLITEEDPNGYIRHLVEKFFPQVPASKYGSRVKYKAIAQGVVSRTYAERILALGEAAGQVKTTTGGGVYYGLLASEIAAAVVHKRILENQFTAPALSEYEMLWKKTLEKEIRTGLIARKIWARLNDTQIERIFHIAKTNGIIPLVHSKGRFDWQSELITALLRKREFWQIFKPLNLRYPVN